MTKFWSRLFCACAFALWLLGPAVATTVVTDMTWSVEDGETMLSLHLTGNPRNQVTILDSPRRVVLDLADTVLSVPLPAAPPGSIVAAARDGLSGGARYRIILDLAAAALPRLDVSGEARGVVLRLRLRPATPQAFAEALAGGPARGSNAAVAPTPPSPAPSRAGRSGEKPFTLVIDPGHGGIDNGATGIDGAHEKDINLAFARKLRDALVEQTGAGQIEAGQAGVGQAGIRVVLTREDDRFVPLAERSAVARREQADLFISVHADSIGYPTVRGATLYTLSERASDTLASDVARSENAADRFAGPGWQQDTPEIHDILMDLMRRENETLSIGFADRLIADLKAAGVRMINNPRRSAGFRVLRAPDVPSVLFELGYLSNAADAQDVQSPQWRRRVAAITAGAVLRFAGRADAEGAPKAP